MKKIVKHSFILSLIIVFSLTSFLYCFANSSDGAAASEDNDSSDRAAAEEDNNYSDDAQMSPAEFNPTVKTTVTVYSHSTFDESTATDDKPADGLVIEYTLYNPEEAKKLTPKIEKLQDEQFEIVDREEKALAKELIKNGRWKEIDEFDKKYVNVPLDKYYEGLGTYSLLHPNEASDAEYPDVIFEFPKSPHTSGAYYKGLNSKYPHIWGFYIFKGDKPGQYYYYTDWVEDYSSLDFSKVYFTELHNTFDITDEIEITGLTPEKQYTSLVKLLKLKDDGSTEEIASTDKVKDLEQYGVEEDTSFEADEDGNAHISAVFDGIELDEGKYVLTVECKSVDGDEPEFGHSDLKDTRETFVIEKDFDDHELFFGPLVAAENESLGEITVPEDNSSSGNSSNNSNSVETGDDNLNDIIAYAIPALLSAVLLTCLIIRRRRASCE